eukprot:Skav218557  [mRNA]  locus=scaffold2599:289177:296658:- [translate_table: standard]
MSSPPELLRAQSANTTSHESQFSFEDDDDDEDLFEVDTHHAVSAGSRAVAHILTRPALEAERQRLLAEASECTGVSEDEAMLLLRGCGWDLAEFNEAKWKTGQGGTVI